MNVKTKTYRVYQGFLFKLGEKSERIFSKSHLTTLEVSSIFGSSWNRIKNKLKNQNKFRFFFWWFIFHIHYFDSIIQIKYYKVYMSWKNRKHVHNEVLLHCPLFSVLIHRVSHKLRWLKKILTIHVHSFTKSEEWKINHWKVLAVSCYWKLFGCF